MRKFCSAREIPGWWTPFGWHAASTFDRLPRRWSLARSPRALCRGQNGSWSMWKLSPFSSWFMPVLCFIRVASKLRARVPPLLNPSTSLEQSVWWGFGLFTSHRDRSKLRAELSHAGAWEADAKGVWHPPMMHGSMTGWMGLQVSGLACSNCFTGWVVILSRTSICSWVDQTYNLKNHSHFQCAWWNQGNVWHWESGAFALWCNMNGASTINKIKFEKECKEYGVQVKAHHTDNGIFSKEDFMEEIEAEGQRITFSGVGAHHMNGVTKRSMGTTITKSQTMMLHSMLRWPDQTDVELWPCMVQWQSKKHGACCLLDYQKRAREEQKCMHFDIAL